MSEQTRHEAQIHATIVSNIFAGLERLSILVPTSGNIVEVPF